MSDIQVESTIQRVVVDDANKKAQVVSTTQKISVAPDNAAVTMVAAPPQPVIVNNSINNIMVLVQTQRIVVNPSARTAAVVTAGPIGPRGPVGPPDAGGVLTVDGQIMTRAGGDLAPISRADLAADPAFSGFMSESETGTAIMDAINAHLAASNPHPEYLTSAEGDSLIATHEAASNPHPGYLTPAEGDAAYQPLDADLTAIAALTSAADKLPYATGAGAWALATLTTAGRAILDDADNEAQRTTLGLGALADDDGSLMSDHTPVCTNLTSEVPVFRYVKIGRVVFFRCYFTAGTVTAAGTFTFTIPHTVATGNYPCAAENAATNIRAAVQSGANTVIVSASTAGANFAAGAGITNIRVLGFYFT